jgi:hypothetical protein
MNVVLRADGGGLELTSDENGWTSVTLVRGDKRDPIGAERAKYLGERLRGFLERPPVELKWVFTLSETHTSAYGMQTGRDIQIRFQDRDAKFFADIVVRDEQRREWVSQLEAWQVARG